MQVVVDVPKGEEQRVMDAFCTDRWTEDSGYTQEQYVNKLVGDYVNTVVSDYERNAAIQQAQEASVAVPVKDEIGEALAAERAAQAEADAKAAEEAAAAEVTPEPKPKKSK